MTSKQLPERPNLEQLKNQAKTLLRSARAKEPTALERFRVLPALASLPLDRLEAMEFALHQAQSVIAREYGFKSWRELHEHVEEQSLSFAAAVDEFVRCATGSARDRAFRLLTRHPANSCSVIPKRWRAVCRSIPKSQLKQEESKIGSRFFMSATRS